MASGEIYKYGTMTRFYDGMPDPTVGDGDPFVIAGVLHRTITLLYGMTMAGKSTLATAWAMAVAGRDPMWLGRPVTRHGHVLIVTGDPDGKADYNKRLFKAGATNLNVYAPKRPAIPDTWSEVAMAVRSESSSLVILDNLSAFVPGTLNDDFAVKQFYDVTDSIARDGAAVLIVAHTSEKQGEHGPSRLPMGSSFIRFGPRWMCHAHRAGGRLRLDYEGNDGRPWHMIVSAPDSTPAFTLHGVHSADEVAKADELRRQDRDATTLAERAAIARFIAGLPEEARANKSEVGRRVAEKFGGKAGTHRMRYGKGAYG